GANIQLLAPLGIHFGKDVLVFFQEGAGVFAALPDALACVAVPCAGFFDDVVAHRQVEHVAFAAYALAVENVELRLAKGRGHLVLYDLDLGAVAGYHVAFFNGRDAADIDAHRRVELERTSAGGGLRVAEHDTDLFAD